MTAAVRATAARALVVAGLALGIGIWSAPPASAHGSAGQRPVDHRTEVQEIEPVRAGVSARVTDLGDHIEVHSNGPEVVILGYSGEPYLRIDSAGVWRNERSPATFLNRTVTAGGAPPPEFDADAEPAWKLVDRGATARWHDHRLHPAGRGPTNTWRISMLVDGTATTVVGTTTRVAAPPWWSAVALVVGTALAALVALRGRRAIAFAGLGILLVVATCALAGARWPASSEPTGTRLVVAAPALLGLVLLAGVVRLRSGVHAAAPWLLFGFAALAISFGLALLPWLSHAVVPAAGPALVWRLVVAIALGAGAVGVVVAARGLREPHRD